jgi:hypothetical protein
LVRAESIIRLCKFFGKLPSEILAEDVEMIQLLQLYELGLPEGDSGG